MLIRDVMSSPAVTVTADTPIKDALVLLDEHEITTMPVVDRAGGLVGIVSEADLLRDAAPLTATARTPVRVTTVTPPRRIGESMTHQVVSVMADDDVEEAVDLLTSTVLKSLPVLLHGRVVGVISRRDLIHALATSDQRIRQEVQTLLLGESSEWSAQVTDGIVTISGPYDDRQRRVAEILAGTIPGVVAVYVR
jgi:CBS-domain-containing membrane protein